jgi:ankyrin repeat protein
VLQWACANGCPCDKQELHIAAQFGHEAVLRALIELGADINKAADDGSTPLYNAAQNGHETVVRTLMEAGADVNKARDNGARRDTAVRIYDTRL